MWHSFRGSWLGNMLVDCQFSAVITVLGMLTGALGLITTLGGRTLPARVGVLAFAALSELPPIGLNLSAPGTGWGDAAAG